MPAYDAGTGGGTGNYWWWALALASGGGRFYSRCKAQTQGVEAGPVQRYCSARILTPP